MVLPNRVLTNGNGHYRGGTDTHRWQREMFQKTRQNDHLPLTSGGFLSTHLAHIPPSTTSPLPPPPSPYWSLISPSLLLMPGPRGLQSHCSLWPNTFSTCHLRNPHCSLNPAQLPHLQGSDLWPSRMGTSLAGAPGESWDSDAEHLLQGSSHTDLITCLHSQGGIHVFRVIGVSSCATVIPAPNTIPRTQQYSVKISEGLWTDEYATAAVPGTVSQDIVGTQRGWRQPTVSPAVADRGGYDECLSSSVAYLVDCSVSH